MSIRCCDDLVPCCCPLGRRQELPPALRRLYWLAHPKMQLRHAYVRGRTNDQMPHRWRVWWHRRWRFLNRPERPRRRAEQVLAELLATELPF